MLGSFEKFHWTEQIKLLRDACNWLGVSSGRAVQYERAITEFWKNGPTTADHVLAHSESFEIIELYELWEKEITRFIGLDEKIRSVFESGPLLREGENPKTSSNRPRNDAFVYILGGHLLRAQLNVTAVDGIVAKGNQCHTAGDITIQWKTESFDIQCKRPLKESMIEKRCNEAKKQIIGSKVGPGIGIVAIECSALIRPRGALVEKDSPEDAEKVYGQFIERRVIPVVAKTFIPQILGSILYARGPAMIPTKTYQILSMSGRPFSDYQPISVSTWRIVSNSKSPHTTHLKEICAEMAGRF